MVNSRITLAEKIHLSMMILIFLYSRVLKFRLNYDFFD